MQRLMRCLIQAKAVLISWHQGLIGKVRKTIQTIMSVLQHFSIITTIEALGSEKSG